jgi:hypothetical protein
MKENEIEKQLTDMVKTMSILLEKMAANHDKLYNKHGNQKAQLVILQDGFEHVKNRLESIVKILHEGNGQKPLITRVAILEEKNPDIEADIGRLYDKIDFINVRDNIKADEITAVKKVNKEMIASIVSALAAIAAAIAAAS